MRTNRLLFLVAALAVLVCAAPAHAQQWMQFSTCGTAPRTLVPGSAATIGVDLNGNLCIAGSISFTPSGTQNVNITQVLGAALSATNPVFVANPIGATPTDRTITSASGSSQTLMAANASRRGLIIENTGNANCGVNPTGGTAAIGGAGTLTLAPLGSYSPRIPTLSAITVICTSGQPIYAEEN